MNLKSFLLVNLMLLVPIQKITFSHLKILVYPNQNIKYLVIAGLANSYSGYVTTEEEYNMQHYEGAHTLYGPHTLKGYKQVFSSLLYQLINMMILLGMKLST